MKKISAFLLAMLMILVCAMMPVQAMAAEENPSAVLTYKVSTDNGNTYKTYSSNQPFDLNVTKLNPSTMVKLKAISYTVNGVEQNLADYYLGLMTGVYTKNPVSDESGPSFIAAANSEVQFSAAMLQALSQEDSGLYCYSSLIFGQNVPSELGPQLTGMYLGDIVNNGATYVEDCNDVYGMFPAVYQSGSQSIQLAASKFAINGKDYSSYDWGWATTTYMYSTKTHLFMPKTMLVYLISPSNSWSVSYVFDVANGSKYGSNYKQSLTLQNVIKNGVVPSKALLTKGKVFSFNRSIKKDIVTTTLSTKSYVYDGKVKSPTLTVKEGVDKLVKGADYTVTKSTGRKLVGTYKYTVKGIGMYCDSRTVSFKIVPKGTSISELKATSKGFKVTYKKQATQTTGYQVQYSTSSSFSNAVLKTYTGSSTLTRSVTKLTGGKKYYVRVRTYKNVNGTKYYSAWSAKKYVTTKK